MRKRILLIDDEKNLTTAMDSFFQSKGHDIYIANEGRSAFDILKQQKVNLVVLDLNMPGIDGFEVADVIHKQYPGTKVLVLTAYSEEYKDKLSLLKAQDIMTKPFGVLELINKVQSIGRKEKSTTILKEFGIGTIRRFNL